jgi:kynurenine formamidase
MRIRSFIIAYSLVVAILLFADRRPNPNRQAHYSHVVDLTAAPGAGDGARAATLRTRIIAPGALIPGTWGAGQIPAERLIAPLVVLDLNASPETGSQISLDDIANWETQNGMIPAGALIAVRRPNIAAESSHVYSVATAFPVARDAAQFLVEARRTIGFAVETTVDLSKDRILAQQLALRGNYVVEATARLAALPATGSMIIVAPAKNVKPAEAPARILAMVR